MKAVELRVDGSLGYLILNRPNELNSMNDELVALFHEGLDALVQDEAVRVIILTGAGRAFCAGGDLRFMETMTDKGARKRFITRVGEMTLHLESCPKPVIAMVNGVAAGAGVNLMLACDMAIASMQARFIQSFVSVGLIPDCGGLWLLPKAVGMQKAKELMYSGAPVSAEEAVRIGLINDSVPPDELDDKVRTVAGRIAQGSPVALRSMKELLRTPYRSLRELLEDEARVQADLLGGPDYVEGVAAFKEKRAPKF